jgi:hypothetical protein
VLKLLADRGHLDTYNANIEDIIRQARNDERRSELVTEQRPQLTDGQPGEAPEKDGDDGR